MILIMLTIKPDKIYYLLNIQWKLKI